MVVSGSRLTIFGGNYPIGYEPLAAATAPATPHSSAELEPRRGAGWPACRAPRSTQPRSLRQVRSAAPTVAAAGWGRYIAGAPRDLAALPSRRPGLHPQPSKMTTGSLLVSGVAQRLKVKTARKEIVMLTPRGLCDCGCCHGGRSDVSTSQCLHVSTFLECVALISIAFSCLDDGALNSFRCSISRTFVVSEHHYFKFLCPRSVRVFPRVQVK